MPNNPLWQWMYDKLGHERYLQAWTLVWLSCAVVVTVLGTSSRGCD